MLVNEDRRDIVEEEYNRGIIFKIESKIVRKKKKRKRKKMTEKMGIGGRDLVLETGGLARQAH